MKNGVSRGPHANRRSSAVECLWAALLGEDGAAIPFLRYLPERLGPLGVRVEAALREQLPEAPSFVAFEGNDAVLDRDPAEPERFRILHAG